MTKLKQVCNHPAQLLHDGSAVGRRSGKVVRLEEILAEVLAEGDRALCFTQFAEFGHLLVPHLSARLDTEIAFLHGGTPRRRRDEMVAALPGGRRARRSCSLSLKAGGTGLTLTAATHVVHLDRWWNPAVEQQATDRAYRIGQRRTVQVRKFLCPGTVEERIDALIAAEARARRAGRRRRRELAHRAVHGHAARAVRPRRRRGQDDEAGQDDERRAGAGRRMSPPPRRSARSWADDGEATAEPACELASAQLAERPATPFWRAAPPAKARTVRGGIQINATRGQVARTWWSARFLAVLEAAGVGGRLARGRTYARKGQTVSLQVDAGAATARVQGSAPRPYRVRIGVPTLDKAQWTAVLDALAADASLTAAMLAGELPREVEDVVGAQGVALFPAGRARPRHGLHLPGRHRAVQAPRRGALPARRAVRRGPVRGARAARPRPRDRARRAARPPHPDARPPPLPTDPVAFYAGGSPELPAGPPTPPDALLDRVPALPLAVRGRDVVELLRPLYRALDDV